jgi:hypothetical protein
MPPPFNAVLMVGCVNWHDAMCLPMNLLLWDLHSLAMWVRESGNPHSGHASMVRVSAWLEAFI